MTCQYLSPSIIGVYRDFSDLSNRPECLGLVAALVYICALVCFIPVPFRAVFATNTMAGSVNPEYAPHRQVSSFNSLARFQHAY
jgi:hypothetical protein